MIPRVGNPSETASMSWLDFTESSRRSRMNAAVRPSARPAVAPTMAELSGLGATGVLGLPARATMDPDACTVAWARDRVSSWFW